MSAARRVKHEPEFVSNNSLSDPPTNWAAISREDLLQILRTRPVLILGDIPGDFVDEIKEVADVYVLHTNRQASSTNPSEFNDALEMFLGLMENCSAGSDQSRFVFVGSWLSGQQSSRDPASTTLLHYSNGMLIRDNLAVGPDIDPTCTAAKSRVTHEHSPRPVRGVTVRLPCPGVRRRNCCSVQQRFPWTCVACGQLFDYNFDDNLYCGCGKAPAVSFVFRCTHGGGFLSFEPTDLACALTEMKPPTELNILVLGETGVRKSTWLNGMANFVTHMTLDEAFTEPQSPIPMRFTVTDHGLQPRVVSMGESVNEHYHTTGQSVTQLPKTYRLKKGDTIVRLIDTPGIADTRGVEQDKKNFQFIMTHLASYEVIHGICILLKPNDSRLNVMFRFCIKELLTHLHREACHNIVFVFTHTRATFYRPGDTFPVLRKLIHDQGLSADIPLTPQTVYCMDCEAVSFLTAVKCGVEYPAAEMRSIGESYQKSVTEANRLLEHIATRVPHILQNTLSLNDVRRLILTFTEPLAHVTLNVQTNLKLAGVKAKMIQETQLSKQQLERDLHVPVADLVTVALAYPRTVCTSSSCVRVIGEKEKKAHYSKWCHEHCYLVGIEQGKYPNPELKQCTAMQPTGEVCNHCKCSWEKHTHVAYETREVTKNVVDQDVMKLLGEKDGEIHAVVKFMKDLEKRISGLQAEEAEMRKVAAKFGCFLKNNAILLYNDSMEDYLNHIISEEKDKVAAGMADDRLKSCERMLHEYRGEKTLLEAAMRAGVDNNRITVSGVRMAIKSLYTLPLSGQKIEAAVDTLRKVRRQQVQHQETVCVPRMTNARLKLKAQIGARRLCRYSPYPPARRGRGRQAKDARGAVKKVWGALSRLSI